jgi:hypothetical protein
VILLMPQEGDDSRCEVATYPPSLAGIDCTGCSLRAHSPK